MRLSLASATRSCGCGQSARHPHRPTAPRLGAAAACSRQQSRLLPGNTRAKYCDSFSQRRFTLARAAAGEVDRSQESIDQNLLAILDTNSNGVLEAEEVAEGLLNLKVLQEQVTSAMSHFHTTSIISKSTFLDASATAPLSSDQAAAIFDVLFPGHPGYVLKVDFDRQMTYVAGMLAMQGIH